MSRADGAILVLGLGNELLTDDAVGVHVARALAAAQERVPGELPTGTQVVDGGTLGLELLPLIDEARAVVLVDAVELGARPGTVRVLRGKALERALGQHLSVHQAGAADLVAVGRLSGALPGQVALVGIQPAEVGFGLELSEPVRQALSPAIALVQEEAWELALEE